MGVPQTRPMCNRQRAIIVYTLGGLCDCGHDTYPDTSHGCPATPEEWADIVKVAAPLESYSFFTWFGEPKLDPRILQTLRERYPHLQFDIKSRIVGAGENRWWNRDLHINRVIRPATQSYPQQQAFPGQTEPAHDPPVDAQPVQGYPVSPPVHGHPVSPNPSTAPDADSAPDAVNR